MALIKKEDVKIEEEPKVVEEKKKETVTMSKEVLDELMKRIERVESAADKSRLLNFDEKNKVAPSKIVKLKKLNDKIVISWDNMIEDTVEKNANGAWVETQIVKLNFEDKTSKEMRYVEFVRHYKVVFAEVVSETIENSGKEDERTILKVVTDNGKEYNINKVFVN